MKQKATGFDFFCILSFLSVILFGIANIVLNKNSFGLSDKILIGIQNGLTTSFILFGICALLIILGAIDIIRKEFKKDGDQNKRK